MVTSLQSYRMTGFGHSSIIKSVHEDRATYYPLQRPAGRRGCNRRGLVRVELGDIGGGYSATFNERFAQVQRFAAKRKATS
jgi:hypothetical protein